MKVCSSLHAAWRSQRVGTRLGAVYLLSVIVIVAVYAAIVLAMTHHKLSRRLDLALAQDIEVGVSAVRAASLKGAEKPDTAGVPPTGLGFEGVGFVEAYMVRGDGRYQLVAKSADAPVLPALDGTERAEERRIVPLDDGGGGSVYTLVAMRSVDGRPFAIRAARPAAELSRPMMSLIWPLVIAAPAMLMIGLLGARATARQALSPMRRIIRRARALHPSVSTDRLPEDGPADEIRDLKRVINEMLDQVQASLQRERNFADDVAHELRTPLTAQITRAETTMSLLHRNGPADPHEAVHSMLDEARHMQRLITGLLTLTRVATHSEAVALQAVDVVAVAEDCVELLLVLAEEKGQNLRIVHRGRPVAQAEPTMLRQALMNIVHNAIDHCGVGAQIGVHVGSDDSASFFEPRGSMRTSIAIEDNGPGIPPDQLKHVFQRFFRGHNTGRMRSKRGLGLGLAIAKALTEVQGGRISVDSVVHRGTRFVLSFASQPPDIPHRRTTRIKAVGLLRYSMAIADGDTGFAAMSDFARRPIERTASGELNSTIK